MLESVTFHMLLPFLVVPECDVCTSANMPAKWLIVESLCGNQLFNWISRCKSWKMCHLVKCLYQCSTQRVSVCVWPGSVPKVSPCLSPAILSDWLRPLKRIKRVKEITRALLGMTFIPNSFSFHQVLIRIYKVQYDLHFRLKVQLKVQQTSITYFDN